MSTESTTNNQWVFSFTEGDGKNKKLLGGKGANLCEMTQIGLNVPPGFVITTEACLDYLGSEVWPRVLPDFCARVGLQVVIYLPMQGI